MIERRSTAMFALAAWTGSDAPAMLAQLPQLVCVMQSDREEGRRPCGL